MAQGEQIDKVSKNFCKLTPGEKKFVKKEQKRFLRRKRKDIDGPDPQSNRYKGYIA